MPRFRKLTPNLLVADVSRSLAFYVDVLGFTRAMTVPDAAPFAFGSVTSGAIEIFFNEVTNAVKEYPELADRPIGASAGMKEFAVADPDGYLITFAERAERP